MKIKAVQLDLARQKETVSFIKFFIDFIKKYGLNTLFLYLEGRIKTETFPYTSDKESYKPGDIEEIVQYAVKSGIDIIPIISNFGHTEHFLKFPRLQKLAELREYIKGRFSDSFSNVCPSVNETYCFFEKYFTEVSQMFPSEYFHVGNDEVWDIGFCSLCKERIKKGETQSDIFAMHIEKTHEIIVKKLKKKMMMWDDMFEMYPQALEKTPKDIIMCTWDYDYFVYSPHSHFTNYEKEDVFKKYEKTGFRYVFCPRDVLIPNICSFTKYAQKYNPLGGLITNWERSTKFQFDNFPVIAFTGKLWNCRDVNKFDIDNELGLVLEELTGKEDVLTESLKRYYYFSFQDYRFSPGYITGEIEPLEEENYRTAKLLSTLIKDTGKNEIVENIKLNLKEFILRFELRKALYENLFLSNEKIFKNLISEIDKIKNEKLEKWSIHRKNIPEQISNHYNRLKNEILECLEQKRKSDYFLFLRFFLPDIYAMPNLSISIFDKNRNFKKICEGLTLKPPYPELSYYSFFFPFNMDGEVPDIKIEVSGYGGQGISYLKIIDKNGDVFVPYSIKETQGIVENQVDLLIDNLRWTYLGLRDTKIGFKWNEFKEIKHSIVIEMKPVK
ncbi:MAG: family 20 glycosylhydrolase [Candidatus Omnitrophica bacterium]|nr:family 20 glycosylhydrolase [Candidatus Omnitrophota bacterium]